MKTVKKVQRETAIDNTRVKKLPTISQIKSGEKISTAKRNKNYESSLKNKATQKRKEATNADMLSTELMMSDNNFNRSKLADKLASEKRKSADSLDNAAKKNKLNPKYKPALKNGGSVKAKDGKWMQKAAASIKRRGTEGVCTGAKFGGPTCKPGSKRYALAKTFKSIAKKKK
jgi:hypothetical protein